MPEESALIGTKKGFTQGTATLHGADTTLNTYDTKLLIKPDNMNDTTIVMEGNCAILDLEIIYPEQIKNANNTGNIEKYPLTISGKHGCSLVNLLMFGAYNFYEHTGERCYIDRLFGYCFGTAISIKDSNDISYLSHIHLNPNVIRLTHFQITINDLNNIAINLYNCDGVLMQDIHCMFYRIFTKYVASKAGGAKSFIANNLWIDCSGTIFDVSMDTDIGVIISNAICIGGYSTDADNSGLMVLDNPTNTIISTYILSNVKFRVNTTYNFGVTPNQYIKFKRQEGMMVMFSNVDCYGAKNMASGKLYNTLLGYARINNKWADVSTL